MIRRVKWTFATCAAAMLWGLPGSAFASPFDLFGMGARSTGMGGAMVAAASGVEATHHNPAGLMELSQPELLFGYQYHQFALSLDGKAAGLMDARGTTVGIAAPVKVGRVRLAAGIGLYLPDQMLARIQLIPASEPHFVQLDNAPHRVVVEPMLAFAAGSRLSIGFGAHILADARGTVQFDVGVVGGEQIGNSSVDVSLPLRAAPAVGVIARPHSRVRLGVAARGAIDLRLGLGIVANVDAAAVSGDALVAVRAPNYYTPAQVTFGAAIDLTRNLLLSSEIAWNRWSGMNGALPDVRVLVALGITPPLIQSTFPPDNFRDTYAAHLGVEWRGLSIRRYPITLRGGYRWEPSPTPAQVGLSSLADSDRQHFSAGATVTLGGGPFITGPVYVDLALSWIQLRPRTTLKRSDFLPGDGFTSSGHIAGASLAARVEF